MMSNSEARKRQYDADAIAVASANAEQRFIAHDEARAAGELVADVDMLTGLIGRHGHDHPRGLAEALVAAGFGHIDAARREIAAAERRGVERALAGVMTHNESPVSPTNLRWAATHEALCRSFIFDVLTGLADALDNRAHQIGRDS